MKIAVFLWSLSMLVGCAHVVHERSSAPVTSARELYDEGVRRAQTGDLTRAEQYFAAALRGGYHESAVTRALVSVCIRASRLRSALSYADAFLAAHPGDLALRRLVGTLHWALAEPEQAQRELELVLARAPDDANAHFLLGLVLSARAQHAQASGHYAHYLGLAPDGRHADEAREALRRSHDAAQRTAPRTRRTRS
jgi:predicted Zn-dependent protease